MAQVATTTRPTDIGLRREMGFIGATWASVTSIIGSGWLFGSWKGAYSTGTSAILAWVIGGVCIIILALVHAELGGMYPVSYPAALRGSRTSRSAASAASPSGSSRGCRRSPWRRSSASP